MMKKINKQIIPQVVLWLFLVITFFPVVIMLINSLKTNNQMLFSIIKPMRPFHFENYVFAWEKIAPYMKNSFIVTIITLVGVLFFSSMSGYAFAKFRFPGKNFFYTTILMNMMIPGILLLVPSFLVVQRLGLYNSRLGLIIPYIVGGQIMGTFLVRGFVEEIPDSLFEAAKIDGAKEFQIFIRIAVPLIKPILSALAILNIMASWNDIVWPLIILKDSHLKTIPLGLAEFNTFFGMDFGKTFAGYTIAAIPLLVFFLLNMRGFMDGLTEGSAKM